MKKTILSIFLAFMSIATSYAQTEEPTHVQIQDSLFQHHCLNHDLSDFHDYHDYLDKINKS